MSRRLGVLKNETSSYHIVVIMLPFIKGTERLSHNKRRNCFIRQPRSHSQGSYLKRVVSLRNDIRLRREILNAY